MSSQQILTYQTAGRSLVDITADVRAFVAVSAASTLCNIFVPHTSASLILNENWDPDVQHDLQAFFKRLVPDGDQLFVHNAEGPDDMPAHIRTALTQSSISVPVSKRELLLGAWQGIFLWEHRTAAHSRNVVLSCL